MSPTGHPDDFGVRPGVSLVGFIDVGLEDAIIISIFSVERQRPDVTALAGVVQDCRIGFEIGYRGPKRFCKVFSLPIGVSHLFRTMEGNVIRERLLARSTVRPEVRLAGRLADQCLRLEVEFGMTPSSRSRVNADGEIVGEETWMGALLRKQGVYRPQ